MGKLRLKALAIILKKITMVMNIKFATKSELNAASGAFKPSVSGSTLVFPEGTSAKVEGSTLVLTE